MQRVNDPELIAEVKKRGLERELIHGEMESLAKEVMVQPSELIALMKEVMEHPLCRPMTKLCCHFLYIPALFLRPNFYPCVLQIL